MIEFLKQLHIWLTDAHPESYLVRNESQTVTYPYLTYEATETQGEAKRSTFDIEIDVFDNSMSYLGIYDVEQKLREALNYFTSLTDAFSVRFYFVQANTINTGEANIKRRNIVYRAEITWRY